jgi:WD40 repeat protein
VCSGGTAIGSAAPSTVFDASRILTASQDKTALIWDGNSGNPLLLLAGHDGAVLNATFSPDGERAITASEDSTARVWDAVSGVELLALRGHAGPIDKAMFTPDGNRIVTGSEDKTARVWDARWLANLRRDELVRRVCADKLLGDRRVFTGDDEFDPVLQGLAGTNPCDRFGPFSLKYWSQAAQSLWRRLF